MTKNRKRILAAALMCAFAVLSLSSCGGESSVETGNGAAAVGETSDRSAGIAVETRTVHMDSVSSDSTVSGMVTADDEASVLVGVTAKVLDTYVEAGDEVEGGQILCRLDLDSTLSNYRAARLSLASAQQSYTDQSDVFEKQIAAINEQIALAQKQVPIAEEQISLAEEQIPIAEQQIPQLEQQITTLEQQITTLEESVAVLEQTAGLAEKNVNDTKALYNIGAASQAEIDSAELSLAQTRLQITQTKAQIDQTKAQIDQMNAQIDQAQLTIDQAKLSLSQTQLQPDQARLSVSQAQLSLASAIAQRNSTLGQLQVSIESARSSVQQMEDALENIDDAGNVVAPAGGVLVTFNATKDGYVSSTMPVAVINGTGKMEITVAVSESLIPKLHTGDMADVSVASLGKRFTATIRSVDQTASAQTRLYTVTLAVPENVTGLLSGMFADVTFHTDTVENTVVIPSEAILNDGGTQYVYIVDGSGLARYTEITTGMTGSGVTVVTGGLKEGQTLVTVGQSYLSDGDPVRIVRED